MRHLVSRHVSRTAPRGGCAFDCLISRRRRVLPSVTHLTGPRLGPLGRCVQSRRVRPRRERRERVPPVKRPDSSSRRRADSPAGALGANRRPGRNHAHDQHRGPFPRTSRLQTRRPLTNNRSRVRSPAKERATLGSYRRPAGRGRRAEANGSFFSRRHDQFKFRARSVCPGPAERGARHRSRLMGPT